MGAGSAAGRLAAATLLLAALIMACSPEDGRRRGERGADVGNRPKASADVQFHGKSNPERDVPVVGEGIRKN